MIDWRRWLVLSLVATLAACAQVPKQAFNREAAKHVRTVIVTQRPNQTTYEANVLGHPGMSFGLIGGLVAVADMQAKASRLTAAIDPEQTRLQERFSAKLAESLERAGYTSSVVVLPASLRDEEIQAHVKKGAPADAVVVVTLYGGYWAAGVNTDYQPRLTASVKTIDLLSGSTLYQDTLSYGYADQRGKTVHFPSDPKFRFATIGALTDDPTVTREGLYAGMDALANQIADDLKRN